jgi:hypothetical protein
MSLSARIQSCIIGGSKVQPSRGIVKNEEKGETDSLIDYLDKLPKRFPLDVILPDSQYYSELEKAQMAKAGPVEVAEDVDGEDS